MAYNLNSLGPLAITFVVGAIILGFGAKVLDEIAGDFTVNSTEQAIAQNGTEALGKIGKHLPTLGLVVVAALIIGIVVTSFYYGK